MTPGQVWPTQGRICCANGPYVWIGFEPTNVRFIRQGRNNSLKWPISNQTPITRCMLHELPGWDLVPRRAYVADRSRRINLPRTLGTKELRNPDELAPGNDKRRRQRLHGGRRSAVDPFASSMSSFGLVSRHGLCALCVLLRRLRSGRGTKSLPPSTSHTVLGRGLPNSVETGPPLAEPTYVTTERNKRIWSKPSQVGRSRGNMIQSWSNTASSWPNPGRCF